MAFLLLLGLAAFNINRNCQEVGKISSLKTAKTRIACLIEILTFFDYAVAIAVYDSCSVI